MYTGQFMYSLYASMTTSVKWKAIHVERRLVQKSHKTMHRMSKIVMFHNVSYSYWLCKCLSVPFGIPCETIPPKLFYHYIKIIFPKHKTISNYKVLLVISIMPFYHKFIIHLDWNNTNHMLQWYDIKDTNLMKWIRLNIYVIGFRGKL